MSNKRMSKWTAVLYGGVKGELVRGEFNFFEYWKECELNKGKRMSEEEVWSELVMDLTNQK